MMKVNLGLTENQELNLLACYNVLKERGFNPNYEVMTGTRTLRFRFDGYYFNVFHNGKMTVFTSKGYSKKSFKEVLEQLQEMVFEKNVVSAFVRK